MKPLAYLIVGSLLLCMCSVCAETNTNAVRVVSVEPAANIPIIQSLAKDRRWQLDVELAFLKPIRQWGNAVYDFRPMRPAFAAGHARAGEFRMVAGKIVSVLDDGALVRLPAPVASLEKTVFLYRAPFLDRLVDGDAIAVIARAGKPFTYTSAIGAKRTVDSFDCGEDPEPRWVEEANRRAAARSEKEAALARELREAAKAASDDAAAKRKAEIAAKVEKARAEREAKEKLDSK